MLESNKEKVKITQIKINFSFNRKNSFILSHNVFSSFDDKVINRNNFIKLNKIISIFQSC